MASPIGSSGSIAITTTSTSPKGPSIINVRISEPTGVKAENLSLSTWGASFILANHLHNISLPSKLPHSGQEWILELGAGTGLVGLSAAAIWNSSVILTDLPSIVPGLTDNILINKSLLKQHGGSAQCGSLDWSKPTSIDLSGQTISSDSSKASVILAADTIYAEDHPELLSNTILKWLAPGPQSRAILCYPLRMAYIDHIREFWQLMEMGGLECIDEGRAQGDESWNEVANTPYEWCIWRWRLENGKQ